MKKIISKPHPNIFVWIEFIQREESVTKALIRFISKDNLHCKQTSYRKHCFEFFCILIMKQNLQLPVSILGHSNKVENKLYITIPIVTDSMGLPTHLEYYCKL